MLHADRDPVADFMTERIRGARFFDLDAISDRGSPLPHMLPSEVYAQQYPSPDPRRVYRPSLQRVVSKAPVTLTLRLTPML
jgi:hypothetical protein